MFNKIEMGVNSRGDRKGLHDPQPPVCNIPSSLANIAEKHDSSALETPNEHAHKQINPNKARNIE